MRIVRRRVSHGRSRQNANDGQSHTDANCLLWSLNDIPIRAKQCYTDADCANAQGLECSSPTCDAGVCFCGSR